MENIGILSYEHEDSRKGYFVKALGEDFEIKVPPENVLMALCAHREAVSLNENGVDASILTIGGCAVSNKRIIERINELTETNIHVEAYGESNSTASDVAAFKNFESPYIIICQKFAKLRTYLHSRYHLKNHEYTILDWETYIKENPLSKFQNKLYSELNEIRDIPLQRQIIEGVLILLAYVDPKDGFTKQISSIRQRLSKENPQRNIFKRIGFS